MTFLSTLDSGQYSPSLCIQAGVYYCQQMFSPSSGTNIFTRNLLDNNNKVFGNFDVSKFECGYFNFENYSPVYPSQTMTPLEFKINSYDGVYSGQQVYTQATDGLGNQVYTVPFITDYNKTKGQYTPKNGVGQLQNYSSALVLSGFPSDSLTLNHVSLYSPLSGDLLSGPNATVGTNGAMSDGDITIYGRFKISGISSNENRLLAFGKHPLNYDTTNKLSYSPYTGKIRFQSVNDYDSHILDGTLSASQTTGFYNFLFISNTGVNRYWKLYEGFDDKPLTLTNVISRSLFDNYESWYNSVLYPMTPPAMIIWTNYGISNRAWTSTDIDEFNRARLNPGFFIAENPYSDLPFPSGNDSTFLNFHFPANSSGSIGLLDRTRYDSINYIIPLKSGISENLYEFARSEHNSTAMKVDMWVQSLSNNPSGYINAKVVFANNSYWSGYPVKLPQNEFSLITVSGKVFNAQNNPSDLSEISKNDYYNANNYNNGAQSRLGVGAWYQDMGAAYSGDINIYSARIYADAWCIPPSTGQSIPLYTSGQYKEMENLDLYVQNNILDRNLDLFVQGSESVNDGIPLYIAGGFAFNQCDLYLYGNDSVNSGIPLFIDGGIQKATMPLYINSASPSQSSGSFPLSVWATTNSGVSNNVSLFIGENAPSGVMNGGMNLYLNGPGSTRVTSSMNLFLKRDAYSEQSSISLYCHNEYTQSTGQLTLFLSAPSGTLGAIPISGAMNLFIARNSESIAHNFPMYVSGPSTSQENLSVYINGGTPYFSSIPLFVDGIGQSNESVKLYTTGY